jgi:anti-sigma regulatory factor (Ser/Thr protein kinase)
MAAEPPDPGGIDHTAVHPAHEPLTSGNLAVGGVRLALSTAGDRAHAARLRHRLQDWLSTQSVPESSREDVVLATYEAVANAVEHGYRATAPAGSVTMTITVYAGHIEVAVVDHGWWRTPPEDPGYRGRGFALIDALADRWAIDHSATGTTVTLRFSYP